MDAIPQSGREDIPAELPKGIMFDLDDTIIAFDAVAHPAWQQICETFASQIALAPDTLFSAIRDARTWYWSDPERHRKGRLNLDQTRIAIITQALNQFAIDDISIAREMAEAYTVEREARIDFFPHAEATLQYLYDQQVRMALLTNGSAQKQRQKVKQFGLDRFFQSILIEGELGYGKPAGIVYLRALQDLELTPDQVWFVGDNLMWDVTAPQKLGIFSIWHDVEAKGLPVDSTTMPDRIIHSIAELRPSLISPARR